MKKILLLVSSLLLIIGLCSCGGDGGLFGSATPTPIPVVSPTDILSASDVAEFVDYEPVLSGDITEKDYTKTAVYVTDPVGGADSVTVKITQFTDGLSKEDVRNRYDSGKSKRPSAESVEGLGQDAYIAFPFIHIYDRGCEITISAGSGSDEGQKSLLKRMGERAVMNLEKIITSDDTEPVSAVTQE